MYEEDSRSYGTEGRHSRPMPPSSAPQHSAGGSAKRSLLGFLGFQELNIPIVPIAAFVALAAIGIIAATVNAGPQYSAIIEIPGAPALVQQADAQEQPDGDDPTSSDTATEENGSEGQIAVADAVHAAIDLAAIPSSADEVTVFSASGTAAPTVTDASLELVNTAVNDLEGAGIDTGFVFMNLQTGAGIAHNTDQSVYGASSIKGPFAAYVCEELIDSDEISDDTVIKTIDENFRSNGSSSVDSLISSTITQSSNGAFGSLKRAYGGSDYDAWLESLNIDPGIHENDEWFAWYSPREAVTLWNYVYDYLESDSETADWLRSLMEETNVSFIRNGMETLKANIEEQDWEMPAMQSSPTKLIKVTADSVSGYKSLTSTLEDATVANKAGWCVSEKGDKGRYDSTSDNGIVTIDGNDYLLCIMTGAPYSDRSAERVSILAASLISAYDQLA